jgi:dTDP-4-dehydrorhamnose reductase
MSIQKILVTGKNGQLGWELQQLVDAYPNYEFHFTDRTELDLSHPELINSFLDSILPDIIINPAAYTQVDKAETDQVNAMLANANSVEVMAKWADNKNIPFITYSTDYVFNGNANTPYQIDTPLIPINFYGQSKAAGEQLAIAANPKTIIIRTSWVFSAHGNNFVKSMIRLMKERDQLNIVQDQKGRPTYAKDLAVATMQLVGALNHGNSLSGIYHYANQGETTWFDFAVAIKELAGFQTKVNPIETKDFPTPAKRPAYSVLDTKDIEQALGITIPTWQDALARCYKALQQNN